VNASPIFIVGCPRSGTALLRDLLRSHPRLTFPPESHFIPAFYRGYGDPRTEREAIVLARRILKLEWIRFWNLPMEAGAFAPDRSFRDILCRLYGAWAHYEKKPRWGDKTPHYVADIAALAEIFPEGKIIHIIRDGRDVAISWLKSGHEPRNLFVGAERWDSYVRAGRASGGKLPSGNYQEIRYESLLRRPEETMTSVCEFIGEPFVEAVLHPSPARPMVRQPIFGRRRLFPVTRAYVIAKNIEKWKIEMPLPDRRLFESVAGDLLTELGYETEGFNRTVSKFRRFAWNAHHRFLWMAARLNMKGNFRWLWTDFQIRRAFLWADHRRRSRRGR